VARKGKRVKAESRPQAERAPNGEVVEAVTAPDAAKAEWNRRELWTFEGRIARAEQEARRILATTEAVIGNDPLLARRRPRLRFGWVYRCGLVHPRFKRGSRADFAAQVLAAINFVRTLDRVAEPNLSEDARGDVDGLMKANRMLRAMRSAGGKARAIPETIEREVRREFAEKQAAAGPRNRLKNLHRQHLADKHGLGLSTVYEMTR